MNLDIRDSHGKRIKSNDVSNESKIFSNNRGATSTEKVCVMCISTVKS